MAGMREFEELNYAVFATLEGSKRPKVYKIAAKFVESIVDGLADAIDSGSLSRAEAIALEKAIDGLGSSRKSLLAAAKAKRSKR